MHTKCNLFGFWIGTTCYHEFTRQFTFARFIPQLLRIPPIQKRASASHRWSYTTFPCLLRTEMKKCLLKGPRRRPSGRTPAAGDGRRVHRTHAAVCCGCNEVFVVVSVVWEVAQSQLGLNMRDSGPSF